MTGNPSDNCVRRGDDDLGRAITIQVWNRERTVTKQGVELVTLPVEDYLAVTPHARFAITERTAAARTGNDVELSVTVDVDWLAEAKAELAAHAEPVDSLCLSWERLVTAARSERN